MLGSMGEAEDAVQEAWLRLSRSDAGSIENLSAWLTTVVARVCLDMLRSRTSRREEPMVGQGPEPVAKSWAGANPEQEALLADSVGLALLVVLDRLAPAERLAFVLHDMFDLPFEEIATIVGRSPEAARQLASRARRRVREAPTVPGSVLSQQREVVEAFVTAFRNGDFEGLIAVLDADVVWRADEAGAPPGVPREIRGARNWAKGALAYSQVAQSIQPMQPMLVDGAVGLVWAPRGRLSRVLRFTVERGKIVQVDVVADPARLRELDLAVL